MIVVVNSEGRHEAFPFARIVRVTASPRSYHVQAQTSIVLDNKDVIHTHEGFASVVGKMKEWQDSNVSPSC